jgi:hypothetical protein
MEAGNQVTILTPAYRKIRDNRTLEQKRNPKKFPEEKFGSNAVDDLSHRLLKISLIAAPLLIGAGLWLLGFSRNEPESFADESQQIHSSQTHAQSAPKAIWAGLQPRQIAENFLQANTQEERLKWVRESTDVAGIVGDYYRNGRGAAETMLRIRSMDDIETEEGLLARFMVEMKDGSERLLFVPYFEGGGRGVDFKSFSIHCSQPWNAILDGSATKVDEVRINLEPASYYNFHFADETKWLCFAATSPNLEGSLHFYAHRDDPALHALINYPFASPLRFTVSIESTGQSHQHRQWRLSKVLFPGWVKPTTSTRDE